MSCGCVENDITHIYKTFYSSGQCIRKWTATTITTNTKKENLLLFTVSFVLCGMESASLSPCAIWENLYRNKWKLDVNNGNSFYITYELFGSLFMGYTVSSRYSKHVLFVTFFNICIYVVYIIILRGLLNWKNNVSLCV